MDNSKTWKIIDAHFRDNPQSLVRHHTESYNDFFKNGIYQIFKEKNPIRISSRYDPAINDYRSQCNMYFGGKDGTKIYFGKPIIYDEGNSHYMFPNEARLRNMTYGMTIHYDVEVEFIDILEPGEAPSIMGSEMVEEMKHSGGELELVDAFDPESLSKPLQNFKVKVAEKLEDGLEEGQDGGDGDELEQNGGGPPPAGRKKRREKNPELQMTPAMAAMLREATEKSMLNQNTQRREITLEKVYLGKFPVMVQSDFCILSGLPREMRYNAGECKNDLGGYFIIDGKEKTIIPQEKFANNMLYIHKTEGDTKYTHSAEIRSVSENVSKPVRTFSVKLCGEYSIKVGPTFKKYTGKNIVVNIPNVRKPVPLFIVFRALGFITDKEIITMCLLDLVKYESMVDLFVSSVHDAGGILTQQTALKYIATLTKGKTVGHALEILTDYFLPHIGEVNYVQKAYYLGYIVFRLLSVSTGIERETDRDNFKYKRLELVGSLINDLFREYYTIQQKAVHLAFEERLYYNQSMYEANLFGLIHQNYREVFRERAVEAGFKRAFKGNWGAYSHTKRIGIIQDLNRLSFNSALSHLRKTNLPMDASVKLVGPRVLHSSQWGIIDPIDTPDGGNIGLHKSLSISTYVTRGYERGPMIEWLREKTNMKLVEECTPPILANMTKVMVNGFWAGAIDDPIDSIAKIRLFRRNALIPIYTSVTFEIRTNTVYIYTDAGRLCRPIFYRDEMTDKISYDKKDILKLLEDGEFSWDELISGFNKKKVEVNEGKIYELHELYAGIEAESNPARLDRFLAKKAIIDYIDGNESENALIAINTQVYENKTNSKGVTDEEESNTGIKRYTHAEIHESLILGMMSNQIIFPENNPPTRDSFSCGQSKQAVSMYHTNFQMRMDKTAVVLNRGQVPLVKSRFMQYINHEENPYGENAIVAIMCYTGYNVEDAILVNEGALRRGLFRTTYYSTYEAHEESSKTGDVTVDKRLTNIESEEDVVGTKPGYDYSHLDKFGLIREGTAVNDKTILIGMTSRGGGMNGQVDNSKGPKKGQLGTVDKTFITDGEEGQRIAKVRLREDRIPAIGDKMASRSGQKGTIGLVIPECDMPFTKDGIRPDLIINPHALPSRMTIGQLVECITGKACAMYGAFGECTAFQNRGSKIGVFGELLPNVGFHSSGNDILYNGMTGQQLEAEIFIGPTYYMRLKHMVKDKINHRALGPRSALTKQAVGGRANDGGLRIGEMERDTVISHGISNFLTESMMERGDKYFIAICNQTGMTAIYNPSKNLFMSPMADGPIRLTAGVDNNIQLDHITRFGRSFSIVAIPYSLKLLIQELQTMNVQMRIITDDNIQQIENMAYSKNIDKLMAKLNAEPKDVVSDTMRILRIKEHARDVYITPEQAQEKPTSPVFLPTSPEFSPESLPKSPAYAPGSLEGSPAYEPAYAQGSPAYEPAYAQGSPAYEPKGSPAYEPKGSPAYEPNYAQGSPAYEPNYAQGSPAYAPVYAQGSPAYAPVYAEGSPAYNPTSDSIDINMQAHVRFSKNDIVYYRGDFIPNRLWKITNIGDKFITVETENDSGLEPGESVKVVTAIDIFLPQDVVYDRVQNETINEGAMRSMMGGQSGINNQAIHHNMHQPYMNNPNPNAGITFAPQFKIITGGDDKSTNVMPDPDHQPFTGGSDMIPTNSIVSHLENSLVKGGAEPLNISNSVKEEKRTTGGDNSIDFGKPLLIKKV